MTLLKTSCIVLISLNSLEFVLVFVEHPPFMTIPKVDWVSTHFSNRLQCRLPAPASQVLPFACSLSISGEKSVCLPIDGPIWVVHLEVSIDRMTVTPSVGDGKVEGNAVRPRELNINTGLDPDFPAASVPSTLAVNIATGAGNDVDKREDTGLCYISLVEPDRRTEPARAAYKANRRYLFRAVGEAEAEMSVPSSNTFSKGLILAARSLASSCRELNYFYQSSQVAQPACRRCRSTTIAIFGVQTGLGQCSPQSWRRYVRFVCQHASRQSFSDYTSASTATALCHRLPRDGTAVLKEDNASDWRVGWSCAELRYQSHAFLRAAFSILDGTSDQLTVLAHYDTVEVALGVHFGPSVLLSLRGIHVLFCSAASFFASSDQVAVMTSPSSSFLKLLCPFAWPFKMTLVSPASFLSNRPMPLPVFLSMSSLSTPIETSYSFLTGSPSTLHRNVGTKRTSRRTMVEFTIALFFAVFAAGPTILLTSRVTSPIPSTGYISPLLVTAEKIGVKEVNHPRWLAMWTLLSLDHIQSVSYSFPCGAMSDSNAVVFRLRIQCQRRYLVINFEGVGRRLFHFGPCFLFRAVGSHYSQSQ
ncbi:hypothetical protein KC356_g6 [Hortaea werneckii]|nr:hypothetical protein KC356_g6 [Hortaea werneckii]